MLRSLPCDEDVRAGRNLAAVIVAHWLVAIKVETVFRLAIDTEDRYRHRNWSALRQTRGYRSCGVLLIERAASKT